MRKIVRIRTPNAMDFTDFEDTVEDLQRAGRLPTNMRQIRAQHYDDGTSDYTFWDGDHTTDHVPDVIDLTRGS